MPDRVSKNSSNIATLRALTSRNTDSDQTCAYEPMLLNLMLLMYIVTNNSNKLEISAIIKGVIGWDSSGHVLVHAFGWTNARKPSETSWLKSRKYSTKILNQLVRQNRPNRAVQGWDHPLLARVRLPPSRALLSFSTPPSCLWTPLCCDFVLLPAAALPSDTTASPVDAAKLQENRDAIIKK